MRQISLIDHRIEKIALFEINLCIYLGAEISSSNNFDSIDLSNSSLLIAHCNEEELPLKPDMPIILLNDNLPKSSNIFSLPEDCDLKSLLKTAAKILGVTAQEMAQTEVPNYFPIPTRLFKFLGFAPNSIYKNENGDLLLEKEHPIKEELINSIQSPVLYIDANQRVSFADSFSGQLQKLAHKLQDDKATPKEQIVCLDQTMSVIASRLQFSGMDKEVISLAQESIQSLVKIADQHTDARKLIQNLYNNDTTHRYKNSQLLLFTTFHALKTLDWWIEKQREALSSAAFFHDILFKNDDASLVRSKEDAKGDQEALILNHAAQTGQITKKYPEISQLALTIITQHHGNRDGKGFSNKIDDLDPLAKLFIICEIYTNKILSHQGNPFNEDELFNDLKRQYVDNESQNIISALSKLDLNQIISAVTADLDEEIIKISEQTKNDHDITYIIAEFDQETQDDLALLRFVAENAAGLPDLEQKKIISATTQVMNDLEKRVVKDHEETQDEQSTVIEGVTDKIKEVATIVKGCFQKDQKEPLSDSRDHTGKTKLMVAALSGNMTLIDAIIQENSNIQLTDSSRKSALHYASINGSIEVIEYLVDKGININGLDSKRRTPLFTAINSNHTHAANLLLLKGAWPHVIADNGISLIILASHKGNLEIIKLLHEYKAPLTSKDHRNKDALQYAKSLDFDEIAHFLEETID